MPDELLRAAHFCNSAAYSHIMGPLPHFMLITGQAQSQQSPPAQARGGYRLFALGIYYNTSDLYGKASDFFKNT